LPNLGLATDGPVAKAVIRIVVASPYGGADVRADAALKIRPSASLPRYDEIGIALAAFVTAQQPRLTRYRHSRAVQLRQFWVCRDS